MFIVQYLHYMYNTQLFFFLFKLNVSPNILYVQLEQQSWSALIPLVKSLTYRINSIKNGGKKNMTLAIQKWLYYAAVMNIVPLVTLYKVQNSSGDHWIRNVLIFTNMSTVNNNNRYSYSCGDSYKLSVFVLKMMLICHWCDWWKISCQHIRLSEAVVLVTI